MDSQPDVNAQPDVSVIVPAFERPEELAHCLRSLAGQRADGVTWEVVVVDDASPVPLAPVVEANRAGLALRCMRNERNAGRAATRNRGAAAARGRLLLFLDADMLAEPELVGAHARAHRRAGEGALAAFGLIPVAPGYRTVLGEYMERRGHMRPGLPDENVPFRFFVSSNTSIARELFHQVGGYDERFLHYGGEDIDLGFRLHRAGARFAVARDAVARHAYRYEIPATALRMREFGRFTLPLVFERHPELRRAFYLDRLTDRGAVAAAFHRALVWPPFLALARAMAPAIGRTTPIVLSYVLVGNYFRGYADHLADAASAGASAREVRG